MSFRQNPPKQSPAHRARKPVVAHNNEASVGHGTGSRKRKTITDPANGRDYAGGQGNAPGAGGPATTGAIGPRSY